MGVLNLMPRAETYERLVEAALGPEVTVSWRRLRGHGYTTSDPVRLAHYVPLLQDLEALDALILTGAPVEALPFAEVRYWPELDAAIADVVAQGVPLLGLCWGGLVVASHFGIGKVPRAEKLFGVFTHEVSPPWHHALGTTQRCPQSRLAAFDEASVSRAVRDGRAEILAASPETGTTLLRCGRDGARDGTVVAHLGHPEYDADRLLLEWDRDADRPDVAPPVGYDLAARRPLVRWQDDSVRFFAWWTRTVRAHGRRPEQRP